MPSVTTRQLTGLFGAVTTTKAVAIAAKPSPRPVSPRPSVVVAETETGASRSSESTFCASARRGAILGRVADHLDRRVADAVSLGCEQSAHVTQHVRAADAAPLLADRSRTPRRCHPARQPTAARHRAHVPRHRRRNGRRSRQRRQTTDTATNTAVRPGLGVRRCQARRAAVSLLFAQAAHRRHLQEAAARTSSRMIAALASSVFSASASSPTRICRALASIRFSPADSPRS